ncbi:MAG: ATP-dependent DNA helicase RecG [Phycisphaeraceae bacterium]
MTESAAETDIKLSSPVTDLPGVGKRRARLLGRLGIRSVTDLLRHLPLRYERHAGEDAIDRLQVETIGSARGVISAARWAPSFGYGKKGRFEATLQDATGTLNLTWFNAGYLRNRLHPGMTLRVQGKVKLYNGYPQMANPRWEVLDEDAGDVPAHEARLRPVYPATEDLASPAIEELIACALPRVLDQLPDPLPGDLIDHHAMPGLAEAFRMVHQPETEDDAAAARRRLAYNELLLLQLGIQLKRSFVREKLVAPPLETSEAVDAHIRERFPFELTKAQDKVLREIAGDLAESKPMNRLLQGDVGSGKTVVALYALLAAVMNRKQAALMAPTELLAEQHYLSISTMLEGAQVRLALLTGAQPAPGSAERTALLGQIERGEIDIVIGTHALLTESVRFQDLAVAVIDEQHRFGVEQRAVFRSSEGKAATGDDGRRRVPHHLVMTATPIPRTLSLTVFGDLDVSTIGELPPGRTPITNRVVGEDKADEVYRYLTTRLERGEQAYVVVPAIEPGEQDGPAQLKTVREHAKLLQDKFCQGYKVAAIHGRLKRSTREQIMDRFRRGKIHVLVATTVIEVGVDVPTATVMVIEHAERFGLAQLHQLRGRVGRAPDMRSLCVFVAEPTTEDAQKRIEAISSTNDGFRVAEMDLEIRGMGDFFGTRQSGLPPLRVAEVPKDMDLLMLARRDAGAIIENDPLLASDEHRTLRKILLHQYGEALGLIDVG